GVPIFGRARLLEQFDSGGVEGFRKAAGLGFAVGAIGVEPHRCATADRLLDRLDTSAVVIRLLADLDLEGAKAALETPLDLFGYFVQGGAVEWRQQRQTHLAVEPQ